MSELPKGISLLCNDLGEIEQIVHDDIGIPALENTRPGGTIFFRLVDRSSLDKARAFMTDLRISRKIVNQVLVLKTNDGTATIHFSGAKAGHHFLIVGAKNVEDREKLYAEMLASVNQQKEQAQNNIKQHPEEARAEQKHLRDLEHLTSELSSARQELTRKNHELEKASDDIYALAITDSLTGVYNRRHFIGRLKEELRAADRYKRSPAFMLVDIDHFSEINEKYGYQTGDEILKSMGEITLALLRKVDIVGRIDGDEFAALLLEITHENSLRIARRLQKKLSDIAIEVKGNSFQLTVSIALIYLSDGKAVPDKLIRQAEKLLEKAKQVGGNQVIEP